ncbi:MAG: NUDIX domain-containing protein [Parcubacteria group bacterium]
MISKNLYKKIQEVIPICCVDVVIKNDKKELLLLKRKNEPAKGEWWIVGGRIKKGETLRKAVFRKVKEETGLNVVLKGILGVGPTVFKKGIFGQSVHTINIVFLTLAKRKDKIRLDSQSSDYKWFKKINRNWHPHLQKFLKLGLQAKRNLCFGRIG